MLIISIISALHCRIDWLQTIDSFIWTCGGNQLFRIRKILWQSFWIKVIIILRQLVPSFASTVQTTQRVQFIRKYPKGLTTDRKRKVFIIIIICLPSHLQLIVKIFNEICYCSYYIDAVLVTTSYTIKYVMNLFVASLIDFAQHNTIIRVLIAKHTTLLYSIFKWYYHRKVLFYTIMIITLTWNMHLSRHVFDCVASD